MRINCEPMNFLGLLCAWACAYTQLAHVGVLSKLVLGHDDENEFCAKTYFPLLRFSLKWPGE